MSSILEVLKMLDKEATIRVISPVCLWHLWCLCRDIKDAKDVKTWCLYKARYMSPKDAHSLWKMFFIFQRWTTSLWSMSLDIFALANSIPIFFLADFQQIYKMVLSTRYTVLKLLHRICSVCTVVTWSSNARRCGYCCGHRSGWLAGWRGKNLKWKQFS